MSADLFTVAVEEHFGTQSVLDRTAALTGPMSPEAAQVQVPLLLDLDGQRLAAMDAAGVDVQVISHTAPGLEHVPRGDAPGLAEEANDMLVDAIGRHPMRIAGLAALPVSRAEETADELRRAVGAVRLAYCGGLPERVGATLATAAWGWHAETAVHVLRMMVAGVFRLSRPTV